MINSINQNTLKMFGEQNESTCGKKKRAFGHANKDSKI